MTAGIKYPRRKVLIRLYIVYIMISILISFCIEYNGSFTNMPYPGNSFEHSAGLTIQSDLSMAVNGGSIRVTGRAAVCD